MPSVAAALRIRKGGSTVAHLVTDRGAPYALSYTPETFQLGGVAPKFGTIERPGMKPLVGVDSKQLYTLQFTHPLASPDGAPINGQLKRLQALAGSGKRVRIVGWHPGGPQWWTISDLTVAATRLTTGQQVAQADLTWQLVEYSDTRPKIGRVRPQSTTPSKPGGGGQNTTRYTVRTGDTVYSIAQSQLGDSSRWKEIVELNPKVFPYGAGSVAGRNTGRDQSGGRDTGSSFRVGVVLILPAAPAVTGVGSTGGGGHGPRVA